MKTGDRPSGPPPRGRTVFLLAKRKLRASCGYNLRAMNLSVDEGRKRDCNETMTAYSRLNNIGGKVIVVFALG